MIKTHLKELPAYQFHLLQKYSDQIHHAVFTRAGGVSEGAYSSLNVRFTIGDKEENVKENRGRISGVLPEKTVLISANQTHSKNVMVINEAVQAGEVDDIDAFVTNARGVSLMVQVADCQAILMYAPSQGVIAAIHAGWRGLVQDISGEVINVMQDRFGVNPSEILVGISPSLGPCCAFFSNPSEELPKSFTPFIDAKKRVDLWGYSIEQLKSNGIKPNHIELARVCTQCENGRVNSSDRSKGQFYSFRGDKGITGRFGVVIGS